MPYELEMLRRPTPFQTGNLTLWSNAYIGNQVLARHLDAEVDSGSRKRSTVSKACDWIGSLRQDGGCVLDVGCGPGLYAPGLVKQGYAYDGIDISPYSIQYAQRAFSDLQSARFIEGDMTTWSPADPGRYHVILFLYGVYSFVSKEKRLALLRRLRCCLADDGILVLELFTSNHYKDRPEQYDWEYRDQGGFWSPQPYLELNAFRRYGDEDLVLFQAGVVDGRLRIWNSWIRLFDVASLEKELFQAGFKISHVYGSCYGSPFDRSSEVLCACATKRLG